MGAVVSSFFNSLICILTLGLVCNLDNSSGGDDGGSGTLGPIAGWYLGEDNDNCINTCVANGLVCNEEGLKLADDLEAMENVIDVLQNNDESYYCYMCGGVCCGPPAWAAPLLYVSDSVFVFCHSANTGQYGQYLEAPRCDAKYSGPDEDEAALRMCCCTTQDDVDAGITTPCEV